MLRKINNDFYFISSRLKKINKKYEIFYNFKLKVFEVYEILPFNKKQFAFTVGKKLDKLTLKKAVETNVKNAEKIFKSIMLNNKKLDEKKEERLKDYTKEELNSLLEYANQKNCDINFNFINQTRWI